MAVRLIARTVLLRSKRDNGKHTVARRSKETKEKGMREKEVAKPSDKDGSLERNGDKKRKKKRKK